MALAYEVDDISTIDEGQRGLYVESEGKYRLDVSGIDTGDELKSALHKEREARKAAEKSVNAAKAEADRIAQEAAQKNGDFEALHKSSEERYTATLAELDSLKTGIATEKRNNAAMKIATELADGPNAELLSEFISRRLKHTDEGVKVTDLNGELTVSSLDDLKKEFTNDKRYASLIKGVQSSGGGAGGGENGGGAAKTLTRQEFDALNQVDRMGFTKSGGKVTT